MTKPSQHDPYKLAGVNIDRGDALVEWLQQEKHLEKNSYGKVLTTIGGFAGLFQLDVSKFREPILVSSTDGVGTKVLLAITYDQISTLGQDLVAMCVNDLYCVGGRPLFFLDYYATGELSKDQFQAILKDIKYALSLCDTVLLGGETAEMPGLYEQGHFDLAGFVVGVVDKENILVPDLVEEGDKLFALKSTGFHSNGFSLIRKWVKEQNFSKQDPIISQLLMPTKIYFEIPMLLDGNISKNIHGIAHITGGGISGNLVRVIPRGLDCLIWRKKLPTPPWMQEFLQLNQATFAQVEHVFNMGVGMIIVVDKDAEHFISECKRLNVAPVEIGRVVKGNAIPRVIYE